MTTETTQLGLPPDDILERMSGGLEGTAYTLSQLGGALEAAQEEFKYGDDPLGLELARRCEELERFLDGLYLTQNATLTTTRECMACGGQGSYNRRAGEPVTCEECGGTGADPSSSKENS